MVREMDVSAVGEGGGDGGEGWATELNEQVGVAYAAADRAMAAYLHRLNLVNGAGVVVEAWNEARIDDVRDAKRLDIIDHLRKVIAASLTKVVREGWRAGDDVLALGVLAVE